MKYPIKNKRTYGFLFTSLCCSLFIILTLIAMLTYAGGHWANPNAKGYTFTMNFFSDLGTTRSHSGAPNMISHALFSIAVFLAGASLFPFFLLMTEFFKENPIEKKISRITTGFGVVVAISYIGIGFTPGDLYFDAHVTFVLIAFTGTVPVLAIYTFLMFRHKEFPRYVVYIFLFCTIVAIGYIYLMYFGPRSGTISDATILFIYVVGQKIIIYTEMTTMVIAGLGIANMIENNE